jgi:uncharacterized membrane protein YtjA (UPF0391 family)
VQEYKKTLDFKNCRSSSLGSGLICDGRNNLPKEYYMLTWALIFLIIALISGALGFTNVAGVSAQIAKILFIIFIVLFLIALIAGVVVV